VDGERNVFSRSPLARAYRPFIGLILDACFASI
jgi:hypothetical protein